MTVLVDDARWKWRGLRWAHLVSDESYDELHEFAQRLGKRRLGFQGDHYDVDADERERAVAQGAVATDSRDLVRRIRAAGLRNRAEKPRWERLDEWDIGVDLPELHPGLRVHLRRLAVDPRLVRAVLFADSQQLVLLLDLPPGTGPVSGSHDRVVAGGPRADGWRSIEIFVPR